MRRSLTILAATLCFLAAICVLFANRITPSGNVGMGGLTKFDCYLMCALPIGAFLAGRHWYHHLVFLWFGGLGLLTFVPAYVSDNNLWLSYSDYRIDPILHDTAAWTIAILAAAILCMLIGRWARRMFPLRSK